MKTRSSHLLRPLLAGLLTLAAIPSAKLRASTWTGGTGNSNWTTGGNWNGHAPSPTGNADLIFSGQRNLAPNANQHDWNIRSITFGPAAGAFTITGNTLLIGSGGLTDQSAVTQTINNHITLSASQTWTASNHGTLVLRGAINGNHKDLTLNGPGTIQVNDAINQVNHLTLAGAGTRRITQGVSATQIIATGTGASHFSGWVNADTVSLGGSGLTVFEHLNTNGAITVTGAANADFTGDLYTHGITIDSTGAITIGGSGGKQTGPVSVKKGTLTLAQTSGPAVTGALSVSDGAEIRFTHDDQIAPGVTVTLGADALLALQGTSQSIDKLVIDGPSVIDFGPGGSGLLIGWGGLVFGQDGSLLIQNWNEAVDVIHSVVNPGADVLSRVIFEGYGPAYWDPIGNHITPGGPVPEAANYGLLSAGVLLTLWMSRRRGRRAAA